MSTAVPPMVCQASQSNRRLNTPRRPDTRNTASAHPGDSPETIMYPATATRRIPIPQSKNGWRGGRTKKRATARGTATEAAHALPRAPTRTASSPFPSKHKACAGSTASAVSGSGMPKNVLGMISRNVCVISAANIVAASASGPIHGNKANWSPRSIPAIVFA